MHICQPHNQCYWLIFVQCTCAHLCAFESMLMRIENGAKLGRNPDLRSPGLFNPPLLTKHTHTLIGFIPEQAQRGMWGEDLSMALWGLKAPPLLFCTHFGNCANRARVCVCFQLPQSLQMSFIALAYSHRLIAHGLKTQSLQSLFFWKGGAAQTLMSF